MRRFCQLTAFAALCILSFAGYAASQIGPSWSISYDLLPYQTIDEPIRMEDGSLVDDAEVRLSKFRTTFTYPVLFSQGRTVMINEVSYQHIEFDYHRTTSLLDRLHSVGYTCMLQHALSEKWSVLAKGTSSLASDFKANLAAEDLSFQIAAILNRRFSERFTMGFGAAFSPQFGNGIPIPLVSLDWNNGAKWSGKAILPSGLEAWYNYSRRVTLGLMVTGDGDNYRFDPGSYRPVSPEPELRYMMMTVGLTGKIALSKRIGLSIEAGIIGLHRFEFYSGDAEIVSNDLEPSRYLRLGLRSNL